MNTKNEIGLLPNYFKKIGIVIIILAFASMIVIKAMNIETDQARKEIFKIFAMNFVILGLLFVAWAKDKIEDEMTVYVRLKSMAFTFSWAVLYVIIKPLIDLILQGSIGDLSSQQLVMTMLSVYLVMYFFKKKDRFFKKKIDK
jgi:hypothetical protein